METNKEKRKEDLLRIWKILFSMAGTPLDDSACDELSDIIAQHLDEPRVGSQLKLFND